MRKYKYLELTIEYVFKANFNDSYYLETLYLDLDDLIKDEFVWIDPYHKRSKLNDTLIAVKYVSDEEYVILQKQGESIQEFRSPIDSVFICSEDFDQSGLLASHIRFRKEKG
ncbi:MAG: hypothetical protein E7620_00660 [Ruminococcaceae bacterium]|nr:hypothetical protein [Oscillospiraceae bacterium]